MTDIAHLGFEINSSPAVAATKALNDLTTAADGAEKAAGRYSTAASRAADAATKASAADKLMLDTLRQVAQAADATAKSNQQIVDRLNAMSTASTNAGRSINALGSAHKNSAASFSVFGQTITANRMQMMEAEHVARSLFDVIVAGGSPLRALSLESGRVAEIMATGSGGMAGSMAVLTRLMPMLIGGAGFAGLAAVLALAVKSAYDYAESQRKLELTMRGLGAASGITAGQIERFAEASDKASTLSIGLSRNAAEAFASIGHVSATNMPAALGLLKDYAVLTGEKLPVAQKKLAEAFADPAKGAKTLNDSLSFLNEGQLETIDRLTETGDRAGALKELLADLGSVTDGAANHMNTLSAAVEHVGKVFSDAWEAAGKFFDRLADPTAGMDYDHLTKYLTTEIAKDKTALANPNQMDKGDIQDIVDGLQKQLDAAKADHDRTLEAPVNKHVADLRDAVQSVDPSFYRIKRDDAVIAMLQNEIKKPTLDPLTGKRTDAKGNQVGYTDAELQEALKGAEARRKRDERRENGPQTHYANDDEVVAQAMKQRDAAQAALTTDIMAKAKLEDRAIDEELAAQLASLADKKLKSQADREAAAQALRETADLKKQAVDRKAQQELIAQRAANDRAIYTLGDDQLSIMASIVPTLRQRRDIELQLLANRQAEARADLERRIATPGYTGDAAGERNALDNLQHAQTRQANKSTEGPFAQYIDSLKDVNTQMQTFAVEGLKDFNSAILSIGTNSKNAADALKNFVLKMLSDVAAVQLNKAEAPFLKYFNALLNGSSGGSSSKFATVAAPDDGGFTPSYDGGGYTGYGPRSGGVDGKGGFPAILHPHETVVDHTKGQGGPQPTTAPTGDVHAAAHLLANLVNGHLNALKSTAKGYTDRAVYQYDRQLPRRLPKVQALGT